MKISSWCYLTTVILFCALPVWSSDRFDEDYYLLYMSDQALSREQLESIWQQQITPHEAAKVLRLAGNFVTHSISFVPFLHNLYYRLGQLTQSPESEWTPETMQVCIKLARYIALFRTAKEFRTPPGCLVILTAWQGGSAVPENDCTVLASANLTTTAVYTANPGSTLQCTLIALPLRALQDVTLTATLSRINPKLSTACLPIECQLSKVVYSLSDGQWQYDLQALSGANNLDSGMQVYKLKIPFPENAIYGEYEFNVTLSAPYETQIAKLNILVKLEEGQDDL